jgi:hypothetical protein
LELAGELKPEPQRDVLLQDAVCTNGARIDAAVAGVDHNGGPRGRPHRSLRESCTLGTSTRAVTGKRSFKRGRRGRHHVDNETRRLGIDRVENKRIGNLHRPGKIQNDPRLSRGRSTHSERP